MKWETNKTWHGSRLWHAFNSTWALKLASFSLLLLLSCMLFLYFFYFVLCLLLTFLAFIWRLSLWAPNGNCAKCFHIKLERFCVFAQTKSFPQSSVLFFFLFLCRNSCATGFVVVVVVVVDYDEIVRPNGRNTRLSWPNKMHGAGSPTSQALNATLAIFKCKKQLMRSFMDFTKELQMLQQQPPQQYL